MAGCGSPVEQRRLIGIPERLVCLVLACNLRCTDSGDNNESLSDDEEDMIVMLMRRTMKVMMVVALVLIPMVMPTHDGEEEEVMMMMMIVMMARSNRPGIVPHAGTWGLAYRILSC